MQHYSAPTSGSTAAYAYSQAQHHASAVGYGGGEPPTSAPPHRRSFDAANPHHQQSQSYGALHHQQQQQQPAGAERYRGHGRGGFYSPPPSSAAPRAPYQTLHPHHHPSSPPAAGQGVSDPGAHPHQHHYSYSYNHPPTSSQPPRPPQPHLQPPPPLPPSTSYSHAAQTVTPQTPHSYYGHQQHQKNHQHQQQEQQQDYHPSHGYWQSQTMQHSPSHHYAHPAAAYTGDVQARQSHAPLRDDAYSAAAQQQQQHQPQKSQQPQQQPQQQSVATSSSQGYLAHSPYHPHQQQHQQQHHHRQQQQQQSTTATYPQQHASTNRMAALISPTTRIGSAIEHMSIASQVTSPGATGVHTPLQPPPPPLQSPYGIGEPTIASNEDTAAPQVKNLEPKPSSAAANPKTAQPTVARPHARMVVAAATATVSASAVVAAAPLANVNSISGVDSSSEDSDQFNGEVDDALLKRRKRNAQSAARLRERRKNREQELTQSCTVLMTQISQLETELDEEKRRAMVDLRTNRVAASVSTAIAPQPSHEMQTDGADDSISNVGGREERMVLGSAAAAATASMSKRSTTVLAGTKRQLAGAGDCASAGDLVVAQAEVDWAASASTGALVEEDGGPRKRSRPLRELDRARLCDLKTKIETLGKLNQQVCVNLGVLRQEIHRISQAIIQQKTAT
ncbi:hypothetical protein GGH99_004437 [Coemansia sp. RSA 1285]|nr:hypothetical protein GGH99_004437 [Coemansia sp. RSA 1285]